MAIALAVSELFMYICGVQSINREAVDPSIAPRMGIFYALICGSRYKQMAVC